MDFKNIASTSAQSESSANFIHMLIIPPQTTKTIQQLRLPTNMHFSTTLPVLFLALSPFTTAGSVAMCMCSSVVGATGVRTILRLRRLLRQH